MFLTDLTKAKITAAELESLQSSGIYLLKPDYIADYLMQDPPPHPKRYLLSELGKIVQENTGGPDGGVAEQKKRKADELTGDDKRARVN